MLLIGLEVKDYLAKYAQLTDLRVSDPEEDFVVHVLGRKLRRGQLDEKRLHLKS